MQGNKAQISSTRSGYMIEAGGMEINEFDDLLQRARASKPSWFEMEAEQASTNEEVEELERLLKIRLPTEYKAFLTRYGAGYVGRTNVFSAQTSSEWYLPKRNRFLPGNMNFLAVTDDHGGGYYGFLIANGQCSDEIYYVHPDDGEAPKKIAPSFLQYVASKGLAL